MFYQLYVINTCFHFMVYLFILLMVSFDKPKLILLQSKLISLFLYQSLCVLFQMSFPPTLRSRKYSIIFQDLSYCLSHFHLQSNQSLFFCVYGVRRIKFLFFSFSLFSKDIQLTQHLPFFPHCSTVQSLLQIKDFVSRLLFYSQRLSDHL